MLSFVSIDNQLGEPVTIHEVSSTSKRSLIDAKGIVGVGSLRQSHRPRPQAHGGINETRFEDGRTIQLTMEITGTSIEDAFAEQRVVDRVMLETVDGKPALLKWTEDSAGLKLQPLVRLDSDVEPILQGVSKILTCPVSLFAEDPRAYSQALTTQEGTTITGEAVENTFVKTGHYPRGLAIDGTYIYWANPTTKCIGRCKLNGTGVEPEWLKVTGGQPTDVAVSATRIYWVDVDKKSIGRAKLAAGAPETVELEWVKSAMGITVYSAIAIDSNYIYWSRAGNEKTWIGRTDIATGTGLELEWMETFGLSFGIAVNASYIYWSESFLGAIGRATILGKEINKAFITGASTPEGIALDATYIYWSNYTGRTIGRATLAGGGVNQALITSSALSPVGLAANAEHLYWCNWGGETIGRSASLSGSPVGSALTIAQAGNRPTPLTFKIHGPITDPSIVRESDGSRIALRGTITSGNYVEINTAERTVKLNGITNLLSFLNAQNTNWEAFAPLASTKYLLTATSATAAYMECLYRSAYA